MVDALVVVLLPIGKPSLIYYSELFQQYALESIFIESLANSRKGHTRPGLPNRKLLFKDHHHFRALHQPHQQLDIYCVV
jgi:hypothetical protein